MITRQIRSITTCLIIFCFLVLEADAADIVYRKSDSRRINGTITEISRTEVVVTLASKNKAPIRIPANDIKEIKWDKEPPKLTLTRAAERKKLYEKALDEYKKHYENSGGSQKRLRTDLTFLIARTTSELAMNDEKLLDDAITLMEKFRKRNPQHYAYYESLVILNKLYLKKNNSEKVLEISKLIATAPWEEYKNSGMLENAYAHLNSGETDQALKLFDKMIHEFKSDSSNKQLLRATFGKAQCLIAAEKYEKAEEALFQVIDHANSKEHRFLSEVFLVQGKLYRSQKMPKDAILSYLRIDLIFNKDNKAHEEALYWLAVLWKQAGNETRSIENSQKLKSKYPDSEWISKLDKA